MRKTLAALGVSGVLLAGAVPAAVADGDGGGHVPFGICHIAGTSGRIILKTGAAARAHARNHPEDYRATAADFAFAANNPGKFCVGGAPH